MPDDTPPPRLLARRADERGAPTWLARVAAGIVSLGCLALLVVASGLSPSTEGHGTHESLGLEPCGFLQATGMPCATCGMTTSWAHAADGDYVTSFITQPFGMVLALATSGVFWLALHSALFGSKIGEAASNVISHRFAYWAVGALVVAWIYKIVVMAG